MMGNNMEADPGWFSPQVMMGTRDLQVFNQYGEAKFQGSLEGPCFPSNGIELLVAAVGTDVVTGTVAPYTHTISQANALPSLTIEKDVGDAQSLQFAGCRVGKYTLEVAAGNNSAKVSADLVGSLVAVMDVPTAVSVVNEEPFVFAEGTLTIFGTARSEVSTAHIEIDNGLKETYTFSGNHGPSFITPVTLHVMGTLDLVWDAFDDATYGDFNKMQNGTLGALSLALQHPSNGGSVTVACPQVVLNKFSNDLKIADVVVSAISFEASKPLTGASQYTVQAVVMNSQSTAY